MGSSSNLALILSAPRLGLVKDVGLAMVDPAGVVKKGGVRKILLCPQLKGSNLRSPRSKKETRGDPQACGI
jgi:hypothetical protein